MSEMIKIIGAIPQGTATNDFSFIIHVPQHHDDSGDYYCSVISPQILETSSEPSIDIFGATPGQAVNSALTLVNARIEAILAQHYGVASHQRIRKRKN